MKKLTKASMATVSLAASLTMLLAGCGNGSSGNNSTSVDQKPVDGGSLVISQDAKWDDEWVPMMDAGQPMINAVNMSFDSLFNFDQKIQPYPWLAKSYTWSQDHKTITIELQPKANWSDGKPIVSDDVLLFMNWLASPAYNNKLNGQYGYLVQSVLGADKIMAGKAKSFSDVGGFKKISDKEFSITFQQADAAALANSIANFQPLPSHVLGNIPFDQWMNMPFNRKPTVVSGPYTVEQVNGTDSIVYKANPNYWRGKPHIDTITMKYVSADLEGSLLAAGKIDLPLSGVKPSDYLKLKNNANLTSTVQPNMEFVYLGAMINNPMFSDVRVRQAMEYAINRQAIIKGVEKGFGQVINSPVPNISWAAAPASAGLNPYNYDPSKAKQLLDEAGFTMGSDGWRIDPKTGKTAVMHLLYMSGSQNSALRAEAVQKDLQAIGLDVVLDPPLDFNTFYNKVQTDSKDVELYLGAWGLGSDPDPRGIWGSHDAMNYEHYVNPEIDTLIKNTWALPSDFTLSGRAAQFVPFEKFVNENLPLIFLYQPYNEYLYSKKVHIPSNDWIPGFGMVNFSDWWVSNN